MSSFHFLRLPIISASLLETSQQAVYLSLRRSIKALAICVIVFQYMLFCFLSTILLRALGEVEMISVPHIG